MVCLLKAVFQNFTWSIPESPNILLYKIKEGVLHQSTECKTESWMQNIVLVDVEPWWLNLTENR